MAEMEYGQQAIAAQEGASFARAQEARMAAEKGKAPSAPEEEPAPKLTGAALKARDEELGIEGGMTADETRAAIAEVEGWEELHGDAVPDAPEE